MPNKTTGIIIKVRYLIFLLLLLIHLYTAYVGCKAKICFFDTTSKNGYNRPVIKDILSGLIDLVFPRNCTLCHGHDLSTAKDPLCPICFQRLPFNKPPFCLKCSRRLKTCSEGGLCSDCYRHPPNFDYAWGATAYTAPLTHLIPTCKFYNKTALKTTFSKIIYEFLKRYEIPIKADMLLPIPLHPTRLRERGYNQSALIADCLSPLLGIPVCSGGMERKRYTRRQSELGQKERFTNIRGAFKITTPSMFIGRHILLVDDLLTTGATASEAANVLKAAGTVKVGVLTLAIA